MDELAPRDTQEALASTAEPVPFSLPAHTPLVLDKPAERWIITAGSVTLFAAGPARAPATEGARRYIGTVVAGGMICGLGTDDLGGTLIAIGHADTQLLPVNLDALAANPDQTMRLARAVSLWSRNLAGGIARPLAPYPRADIAVTEATQPIRAEKRVTLAARGRPVWVRITGGNWTLLGLESVQGLMPLPAGIWLTGEGGTVEPIPAAAAISDPAWQRGVAAFNEACLAALPSALVLDTADEVNRLRLRDERDDETDAEQRSAFAGILGNEIARAAETDSDQLMPVFRRVAGYLGVAALRPVRVRRIDIDATATLEELARASGLRLRPVQLEEGWWQRDHGALFTTRDDGVTVGLLPERGGWRLITPDRPAGARLDPAMARRLSPEAWAPIVPLPRKAMGLVDLVTTGLRGGGGDITLLMATMLLGGLLGQAVPLATGAAFSLLIPGGHLSELVQLGLALVLVAAVGWVVQLGGEVARQRIEARAGAALHAAIWDRVLRLPLAILSRQTVGETAGRATAAIGLATQLRALSFIAAASVSLILSAAVTMLLSQPLAAAVGVGMLVVQVAAANFAGWLQARAFATGEALSGLADAMVFQIISGLVKLRLAGAESRAQAVWAKRFVETRRRLAAARRIGNGYDAFATAFAVLSTAGTFLVIALVQRVEEGQAPPPLSAVMTFVAAYALMAASAAQLAKAMFALWFLAPLQKFAQPLLEALPEPEAGRVDPGQLTGAVEMTNLAFRYNPADPWIFAGLSLRIEAGEFVAIVGRSGTGKSTLVRLMLGMEEPGGGAIYMDGHDIRGLDMAVLRRQVATVMQSGRVPPGSIRDAVRGLSTAREAEIWQALEQAALAADIRAMPMGLDTVLTDASRVLSGGQGQRLLLARALLQKPAVIILDEATSALDNVTQRAVMTVVRTLPATRIVIAHRLSTIRHADRIIVLDNGRIAETGSFEQLLKNQGSLFAQQFGEEARWQAASARGPREAS